MNAKTVNKAKRISEMYSQHGNCVSLIKRLNDAIGQRNNEEWLRILSDNLDNCGLSLSYLTYKLQQHDNDLTEKLTKLLED